MKNKSTLLAGVLAGMASPTSIYVNAKYPQLKGSDVERLRLDAVRVGNDFNKVINQEYAKEQTASRQKYPAA